MRDWSLIIEQLKHAGIAVDGEVTPRSVGGGDISAAWHLQSDNGEIFLKTGPAAASDMFAAEAEGLQAIAASNTVRVPAVLAIGEAADCAFLALEWLHLERPGRRAEALFGERLAAMHRCTSERFGWHRDNTIGLTPQRNTPAESWPRFFAEHRLGFQLELAAKKGYTGELQQRGERLLQRLPMFFDDYEPVPSLLHGDLWGGNWAASDGEPVMFDPAVYYGDRETDLAMTRLFGGFGTAFYNAYERAWPLPGKSAERQQLYQLYHVLNHLNLFGGGYLSRSLALLRALL